MIKHRLFAGAMAFCMALSLTPTAALAADSNADGSAAQYYSDVTDIIGPITPPDTGAEGTDEAAKPEKGPVTMPDTAAFHSNADFKPYDPDTLKKSSTATMCSGFRI